MAVNRDRLMAYSIVFQVHPESYSTISIYMKPNVHQIEAAGSISRGQSDIYTAFMVATLEEQRKKIAEDSLSIYRTLFGLLNSSSDDEVFAQSLLATIDGALQDDSRQIQGLIQLIQSRESFNVLNLLVRFASTKTIPIIIGAASHILAVVLGEMILRNRENSNEYLTQSSRLIDSLISQAMDATIPLEEATYCLLPLLKIEAIRQEFLRTGGLRTVLVPLLEQRSGVYQPIYAAICCLWMISFDEESTEYFIRSDFNLIGKIIKELKRTDKEKVIRVALGTLKNLLKAGESTVEIMVEHKIVDIIDNLSKRIIKDQDVADLIKELGDSLGNSVKLFSSFEKWLKEIERNDLVPGVTHTEAFWKENAKHLENDSFGSVKKLVQLLNSDSVQTVALALNDIGEFARFHPYGKTVANKLGAKIKAMELMQNPNKDVNNAALLCIQKIMIQNWQSIS